MDIKKILQTFDVLTEGTMAKAEKHKQGPKFTGYWKGTDKATPGNRMVGGESIIPELAKQAKADTVKNKLVREFQEFKHQPKEKELDEYAPPTPDTSTDANPQDVVKVDVPLLIRLLEYAREDAETDMDLHNVAERLIAMSAEGDVLSMDNYDAIVGHANEDLINELGADNPQIAQQGTTPVGKNPDEEAEIAQTAKALATLKPALQAAGGQNIDVNKVTQTLAKTDANPKAQPAGQDLAQISKLAPGVADIMKDPGAAQLFKQALQKATTAQK